MALRFTPNASAGGNRLISVVIGPPGDTGATGATGPTGATGATSGIKQAYSTTTTDSDPGAGTFRLNNATPASATEAYLDNTDSGGSTVSTVFDLFDDSTSTVKGYIRFEKSTDPTAWAQFQVTGSVVDGTGYRKLTLANGAGSGSFTNGDTFAITFTRTGDKGDTGATGATGPAGAVGVIGTPTTGNLSRFASTTEIEDAGVATSTDGTFAANSDAKVPTEKAVKTYADTKQAGDATLTALAAYNTNGLLTQTAADTFTGRTITGTANEITVSNGNGVSGNPTLSLSATANPVGKQPIYIPAAAMVSRTTNGAAAGTAEMTTNKQMVKTLDFDTTTQEFAQFSIRMPKAWNESTVTFIPVWSHAATVTNFGVVWALEAVAISNDDTLDASWGTAGTSTDTGGTTNDLYEGPESSAITIGGTPAEGDTVYFQVKRNVSDGSDTMAIDARLHGVLLYITTNAATDA